MGREERTTNRRVLETFEYRIQPRWKGLRNQVSGALILLCQGLTPSPQEL